MDMGNGWRKRESVRAQNLGRGVPNPHEGCCKYCGKWHSDLPRNGYCDSYCAGRHTGEQLAAGKTMVVAQDDKGNTTGVWLLDTDGVVRLKKVA